MTPNSVETSLTDLAALSLQLEQMLKLRVPPTSACACSRPPMCSGHPKDCAARKPCTPPIRSWRKPAAWAGRWASPVMIWWATSAGRD